MKLFPAKGGQGVRTGRASFLVGVGVVLILLTQAAPASADAAIAVNSPPNFYFYGSTPTSTLLDFYYSDVTTGDRMVLTYKAGSGKLTEDGANDECHTDVGWLPAGPYGRDDNDAASQLVFKYKTDGNTTVRGYVWSLGNKQCTAIPGGWSARLRTALFIHSNGIEGTPWNGNYSTQGCIKVSQSDREALVLTRWIAYDVDNDRLYVTH